MGDEADVAGLLHRWGSDDATGAALVSRLGDALESARRATPADGVGVVVLADNESLRTLAASDELSLAVARAHVAAGVGPAWDCVRTCAVVESTDLATDRRWPALPARLAAGPVLATLSAPIAAGDVVVGAVTLLRTGGPMWADGERATAVRFGLLLGLLLTSGLGASGVSWANDDHAGSGGPGGPDGAPGDGDD